MGDIFFVIRMSIYTVIMIIILQVKVGPTTLEEKLYQFTHQSQLAGAIQGVAQGAARFVGLQYNNLTGHVKSRFVEQHSSTQRPGDRLESKIEELKNSLNKQWEKKKQVIKEEILETEEEVTEDL